MTVSLSGGLTYSLTSRKKSCCGKAVNDTEKEYSGLNGLLGEYVGRVIMTKHNDKLDLLYLFIGCLFHHVGSEILSK